MAVLVESWCRDADKSQKPGFETALFVATGLGEHRVANIYAMGRGIIGMIVLDSRERCIIFAPVEQCSFIVRSCKIAKAGDRVVLGFACPQRSSP